MNERMNQTPPPLLIAGATGYGAWPANSLEGALRCLAAPIDGIEIDVQLTADGHVVAHHDYRPSREQARLDGAWIEAAGPPLKTLTLAEARRYDVGRSRPGSDASQRYPGREEMDGVRMPTLPELLGALTDAEGPRRLFYVEIKTDPAHPDDAPAPAAIVAAVLRDLEAADYVEHAKIIAFDWQVLRLVAARHPRMMTAHLTIPPRPGADLSRRSPWRDGFDAFDHGGSELAAIKAHGGMEWSPYYTDVTPERMAEAGALGLKVGPWGLSRGDDIRRMRDLGVYSSTVSGADWGL
jgi:glycerophosphoryl diester phosphodiesterase